MSPHAELYKRRQVVLPSWLSTYYAEPIDIERGEGRHVWDAEGNRYLDFFGGILTTMTAHALPEVTAAVSEQAAKILHTSTLYLNRPMVELAEQVAELSGLDEPKVFFTASGTEATDTALLLATGSASWPSTSRRSARQAAANAPSSRSASGPPGRRAACT